MERGSSTLTVFAAIIVATVLVVPNGCSAQNLRALRTPGAAFLDLPYLNNDDKRSFRIEQEDKEFFDGMLRELGSFNSMVPVTSVPVMPSSPGPSVSPSATPSSSPILTPSADPTAEGSETPTESPSEEPSFSEEPSEEPSGSEEPSEEPSEIIEEPSEAPTVAPTVEASGVPSASPTVSPVLPPTPSPVLPPTPSPVAPSTDSPTGKCNLSPEGRSALINIFLRVVSNPADVDTPGSPQMLALNWIIDEDPMQLCPQDQFLIQRYVMVVFYFSTRGDRWQQCSAPPPLEELEDPEQAIADANAECTLLVAGFDSGTNAWLTGGTECEWGGLGCNADNFITRIEMEQNGVAGTLPFELNRLQALQNLILEEGILTGTIPSQLSEIRSLEQIDLNFNLLQGPIPEELYSLSNLRQMDLNDNELTGTISSNISTLSRMSFFQIENNLFSGTIPTSFGALTALEVATMDNNQLSGTMPCSFMNTTGTLKVLTSDCLGAPNRPSPPLIICECCTQCF